MDSSTIGQMRLRAQGVAPALSRTPGEVVSRLGAVQGQDYLGALWAVGSRLPGATEKEVERALNEGEIIRTWPMRGTLHFAAPADVRWMLELLARRVIAGAAGRYRALDLDDSVFDRSRDLFISALSGGNHMTRDGMYRLLEEGHISTAGQRGIHILGRLAQEGTLCFGKREGKQQTFALLDEWVPRSGALKLDREAALAELARRYFTAHGPATLQDLTWWSGLPARDARAGVEASKQHLEQVDIDGVTYWMSAQQADEASTEVEASRSAQVYLLPSFDEFLLGYRNRAAVLDPKYSNRINPGSNGMFSPIVVVDGHVAGTWRRILKRERVLLEVSPFAPFSDPETHALDEAAERYGRFLSLSAVLTIA